MILRGVPSGDGECWCLLVTREYFRVVMGRYPDKDERAPGKPGPYQYRMYPSSFIGHGWKGPVDLEINVRPADGVWPSEAAENRKAGKRRTT